MGYITISKKALIHNFNYFSNHLGSNEKVIVGLKDNAYGHGIDIVAKVLSEAGAKHCFVRSLEEAKIAAPFFDSVLILVEAPQVALADNFHTAINSLDILQQTPTDNAIELSIDTGMHRDGIMPEEIEEALQTIKNRKLKLKGVFTHFASSDEKNSSLFKQQATLFNECISRIKKLWKEDFRIHCSNTAASTALAQENYSASRIGLGLYGYSEDENAKSELQTVMSLFAERISTRTLPEGASVGYGSKAFIVPTNNFTVSNYDIGYGNGFFRLNERKIGKIADGRQILGRVSMDSFSLEGQDNEICIFNNAEHLAAVHDTIVYEILTALHANIERRLVE